MVHYGAMVRALGLLSSKAAEKKKNGKLYSHCFIIIIIMHTYSIESLHTKASNIRACSHAARGHADL